MTSRSRKCSPTRIFQSHTAPNRCWDQVAPQVNWQTYVDSSNRQMLRVSGRYAATARSKWIAMSLAFDTKAWIHLSQANAWPIARYRVAVRSEQHRQQGKKGNPHCDHALVLRVASQETLCAAVPRRLTRHQRRTLVPLASGALRGHSPGRPSQSASASINAPLNVSTFMD